MITTTLYREAMARVASGVAIVTTSDTDGRWWGFTASSFTPLSLDPPLILVCLSRDAGCRPAFNSAPAFRVNVLGAEHEQLAVRFATRGVDKFSGLEAAFRADADGLPVLDGALVSLNCRTVERTDAGDHTILIARVDDAQLRPDGAPIVHANRRYWDLTPESAA